jgi:hypothetical protein
VSTYELTSRRGTPEAHWQLGPTPTGGRWTLIGWSQHPESVDAGVPLAVRLLIADALAAAARVTFLTSSLTPRQGPGWSLAGSDSVLRLKRERGFSLRLRAQPAEMVLVSTRSPKTIATLFDDAGYPWWMQSQVALLSEPDSLLPEPSFELVADLLACDLNRQASALIRQGVHAVLRPAVDGDAAGLVGLDGSLDDRVLEHLATMAKSAGMPYASD